MQSPSFLFTSKVEPVHIQGRACSHPRFGTVDPVFLQLAGDNVSRLINRINDLKKIESRLRVHRLSSACLRYSVSVAQRYGEFLNHIRVG
jgi:hypothetical protein